MYMCMRMCMCICSHVHVHVRVHVHVHTLCVYVWHVQLHVHTHMFGSASEEAQYSASGQPTIQSFTQCSKGASNGSCPSHPGLPAVALCFALAPALQVFAFGLALAICHCL